MHRRRYKQIYKSTDSKRTAVYYCKCSRRGSYLNISTAKHLIVVLGMHRSGTSAVTRSLQALGVSLGQNLLEPHETINPKGFFEDTEIVEFNERLLNKLGISWHALAPADYKRLSEEETKNLSAEAKLLLERQLSDTNLFGVKDPRIALLLPFWKPVFESICKTSYIIACRNPLSIARSLEERDKFKTEKSLYLWLNYNLSAISSLAGSEFIVVDYDKMIDAPERQLERLASALKLGLEAQQINDFCNDFLEQGLRHSIFSLQDIQGHSSVPKGLYELYKTLLSLAEDQIRSDNPEIEALAGQLRDLSQNLNPAFHLIDQQQTEFSKELSEKNQQIQSAQEQLKLQEDEIEHDKKKIQQLEDDLAQKILELETFRQQQHQALEKAQQILSSRSWKATEPLRKIAQYFRREY